MNDFHYYRDMMRLLKSESAFLYIGIYVCVCDPGYAVMY